MVTTKSDRENLEYFVKEVGQQDSGLVSLPVAKQLLTAELQRWLEAIQSAQIQRTKILRFQVKVNVSQLEEAILWLRGQALLPQTFFADPRQNLVSAGAGGAHIVRGTGDLETFPVSDSAPADFRYYGGQRFDAEAQIAKEWSVFEGHFFVLPRLELVRSRDVSLDDNNVTENEMALKDSHFYLAVNVKLDAGAEAFDLREALNAVESMGMPATYDDCQIPAPLSMESGTSFEQWRTSILDALEQMNSGSLRKVVLSRTSLVHFPRDLHPLDLLLQLKYLNSYRFCLRPLEDCAFVGCSPERLFKIQDDVIETMALAGTRKRGATPEEDAALSAELLASVKDGKENAVTSEYIQRQLALHAQEVSVSHLHVLKLRHVQHLCRIIRARAGAAAGGGGGGAPAAALRLLRSLNPTPAVCGDSRSTATAFIRNAEPFDRGFFAGPLGVLSPRGGEFLVAIRSGLCRGRTLRVFAGAGIVPGSDPQSEWEETALKMRNLLQAIPAAAADAAAHRSAAAPAAAAARPAAARPPSLPPPAEKVSTRAAGGKTEERQARRPGVGTAAAATAEGERIRRLRDTGCDVAQMVAAAGKCAGSVREGVERLQVRWLVELVFCWCLGESLFRMNPALFALF